LILGGLELENDAAGNTIVIQVLASGVDAEDVVVEAVHQVIEFRQADGEVRARVQINSAAKRHRKPGIASEICAAQADDRSADGCVSNTKQCFSKWRQFARASRNTRPEQVVIKSQFARRQTKTAKIECVGLICSADVAHDAEIGSEVSRNIRIPPVETQAIGQALGVNIRVLISAEHFDFRCLLRNRKNGTK